MSSPPPSSPVHARSVMDWPAEGNTPLALYLAASLSVSEKENIAADDPSPSSPSQKPFQKASLSLPPSSVISPLQPRAKSNPVPSSEQTESSPSSSPTASLKRLAALSPRKDQNLASPSPASPSLRSPSAQASKEFPALTARNSVVSLLITKGKNHTEHYFQSSPSPTTHKQLEQLQLEPPTYTASTPVRAGPGNGSTSDRAEHVDKCTSSSPSLAPVCYRCSDLATKLEHSEAARKSQHQLLLSVQEDLINATEDCKAFAQEYEKVQSEGAEVFRLYEAKCQALRELGEDFLALAKDSQAKDLVLQELEDQLAQEKETAQLWTQKCTDLLKAEAENKGLKAQLLAYQEKEKSTQNYALVEASLRATIAGLEAEKQELETTTKTMLDENFELERRLQQVLSDAAAERESSLALVSELKQKLSGHVCERSALGPDQMVVSKQDVAEWQQTVSAAQEECAKHYAAQQALAAKLDEAERLISEERVRLAAEQEKALSWARTQVDQANTSSGLLATRLASAEADLQTLNERFEELTVFTSEEASAIRQELDASQAKCTQVQSERDMLQKRFENVSARLLSTESLLSSYQGKIASFENELAQRQKQLEQTASERDSTTAALQTLVQTLQSSVSELGSQKAQLETALAALQRTRESQDQALSQAQNERTVLQSDLEKLQAYCAQYKDRAETKIHILQTNLKRAEEEVDSLDLLLNSVRATLLHHQAQIAHVPKLHSLIETLNEGAQ